MGHLTELAVKEKLRAISVGEAAICQIIHHLGRIMWCVIFSAVISAVVGHGYHCSEIVGSS